MIIDIHVHAWPDKIAPRVVERLPTLLGFEVSASGTIAGLLADMAPLGIARSVVLGVAETPRLVNPTNEWLMTIDSPQIIRFGTMLPGYEDIPGGIARLRRAGFKGIKIHALFQNIRPDDEGLFPIYQAMGDDMVALFHTGAGSRAAAGHLDEVLATPERIARVHTAFPNLKIIAAHLGGHFMLEEVERHLLGKSLYLDTSWVPSLDTLDPAKTAALIRRHGADKVLFGTDYPLCTLQRELTAFLRLPLDPEEQELVLGKNAARLLNL